LPQFSTAGLQAAVFVDIFLAFAPEFAKLDTILNRIDTICTTLSQQVVYECTFNNVKICFEFALSQERRQEISPSYPKNCCHLEISEKRLHEWTKV